MEETIIVEGAKILVGVVVGAGSVAIATIKGWWSGKTPEAQKRFLKVVGKSFADGKITFEEYEAILDEI